MTRPILRIRQSPIACICTRCCAVEHRSRTSRSRVLRPSARPLDALLHRDVGALQLLRHARAAHPVHDRAASRPAASGSTRRRPAPIYGLYTSMVYMTSAARRLDRRPPDRPAARGALRRHPDRARPLQHGRSRRSRPSISGLALIVLGTGLLKGNVSVIVGQLYAPDDHAPRRRLLDLLHGDQPRRVPRAARLRLSRPARQLAPRVRRGRRRHDARPRSSTCSARRHLGDAGLHPAPAAVARGRRAR